MGTRQLAVFLVVLTLVSPAFGASECLQKIGQFVKGARNEDFSAFISQLPKTKTDDILSMADGRREVILSVKDKNLWGRLTPLSFEQNASQEKQNFYILTDVLGQIHLFDRFHLEHKVKAYLPLKKNVSTKEIKKMHPFHSSEHSVQMGPLRKQVCKNYRAFKLSPERDKITKILNKFPPRSWRPKLFSRHLSSCVIGGTLGIKLGLTIWPWFSKQVITPVNEEKEKGIKLWIHSMLRENPEARLVGTSVSNFVLSVPLMLIMDQCLKSLRPSAHQKILMTTLGFNVANNIYAELDVPHLKQPDYLLAIDNAFHYSKEELTEIRLGIYPTEPSAIKRFSKKFSYVMKNYDRHKSDWSDFVSGGVLATLTYAYFVKGWEKVWGIQRARLCD